MAIEHAFALQAPAFRGVRIVRAHRRRPLAQHEPGLGRLGRREHERRHRGLATGVEDHDLLSHGFHPQGFHPLDGVVMDALIRPAPS